MLGRAVAVHAGSALPVVDTRQNGDPLQGGVAQTFAIETGGCGIPANAAAYALECDGGAAGAILGYLTIWPTGQDQPVVSTMNSLDGRTKANAAIVAGGYQGMVSVYASNTTNLILDINGYFQPAGIGDVGVLQAHSLPRGRYPRSEWSVWAARLCREASARNFPLPQNSGCIPTGSAQAYSLNFTAIPIQRRAAGISDGVAARQSAACGVDAE